MLARKIKEHIYWMGSVDWDSRLFDSLIPLPDGTSYNAYLIAQNQLYQFLLYYLQTLPIHDHWCTSIHSERSLLNLLVYTS